MTAFFLGGLYRSLEITKIVQTVKYPNDIDTVGDGLLYELFHHVIGVGLVP